MYVCTPIGMKNTVGSTMRLFKCRIQITFGTSLPPVSLGQAVRPSVLRDPIQLQWNPTWSLVSQFPGCCCCSTQWLRTLLIVCGTQDYARSRQSTSCRKSNRWYEFLVLMHSVDSAVDVVTTDNCVSLTTDS